MRSIITRVLVPAVVSSLLLPIVLVIVLGLAGLLASLGDGVGAAVCRGAALAVGVGWLVAVTVTAITAGIVAVDTAVRMPPPADAGDQTSRHAEE
jgi:hypothetical protein